MPFTRIASRYMLSQPKACCVRWFSEVHGMYNLPDSVDTCVKLPIFNNNLSWRLEFLAHAVCKHASEEFASLRKFQLTHMNCLQNRDTPQNMENHSVSTHGMYGIPFCEAGTIVRRNSIRNSAQICDQNACVIPPHIEAGVFCFKKHIRASPQCEWCDMYIICTFTYCAISTLLGVCVSLFCLVLLFQCLILYVACGTHMVKIIVLVKFLVRVHILVLLQVWRSKSRENIVGVLYVHPNVNTIHFRVTRTCNLQEVNCVSLL